MSKNRKVKKRKLKVYDYEQTKWYQEHLPELIDINAHIFTPSIKENTYTRGLQ